LSDHHTGELALQRCGEVEHGADAARRAAAQQRQVLVVVDVAATERLWAGRRD
jgi:hypothetical protein